MRTSLAGLALLGCLLLPADPGLAAAMESSRTQTTVTVALNAITADADVTYGGYVARERISVALDYSATCNIVFNGLTLFRPIPFAPPRIVTGEITNVSGMPQAGSFANTGRVTFDITFNTLNPDSTGTESGLARLNLVLGVDKDCNLATGDSDGVDQSITIRVQIRVSTGSQ